MFPHFTLFVADITSTIAGFSRINFDSANFSFRCMFGSSMTFFFNVGNSYLAILFRLLSYKILSVKLTGESPSTENQNWNVEVHKSH